MKNPIFALVLWSCPLLGCDPVAMAPTKRPTLHTGDNATSAITTFWTTFHRARYDQLDGVIEQLTAAYLEQPRDPRLALLIGHSHLWRLSERARLPRPRASVTDAAVLAAHYFAQAQQLRPEDARIDGWLGGAVLALGTIHEDEKLRRRGYFGLLDATERFPEFNHFSMNYVMSQLPRTHERFSEVEEHMWKAVDVCAGAQVSRDAPEYGGYVSAEREQADQGTARRVCWNSEIAPHNFEGFFLHSGDVLVKAGHPQAAVSMYENAKLSSSYEQWPYADVLDERIRTASERAIAFQQGDDVTMMIGSELACTGCHAKSDGSN